MREGIRELEIEIAATRRQVLAWGEPASLRDGVTPGLRPELHVGRANDWRSERGFRGRNQRGLLSVSENCLQWRVAGSTESILMPLNLGFMRRSCLTSQHPRLHPVAATDVVTIGLIFHVVCSRDGMNTQRSPFS